MEVYNRKELVEAGKKYKDKAMDLKLQLMEIKDRLDGHREVRNRETMQNLEEWDYIIDNSGEEEEEFEPTGDKAVDEKRKKEIEEKREKRYQRLVKKIEKGREEADKIF